jgi:hypothetical protein
LGTPAALGTGPAAAAFAALTDAVLDAVPVVEMADCTVRLLGSIESALGPVAS